MTFVEARSRFDGSCLLWVTDLYVAESPRYVTSMLRRLGILCVLLLSLAGVVPAALACASAAKSADCCPPGQPCETEGLAAFAGSVPSSCCIAQPAPTRAMVAVSGLSDRRFEDSSPPDHAFAPASEISGSFSSPCARPGLAAHPPIRVDQQQVYLRTGRLRL